MDKQMIEEMVRFIDIHNEAKKIAKLMPSDIVGYDGKPKSQHLYIEQKMEIAKEIIKQGAVVLTDKELNEELDTIKCAMIVHDDDGEKYVSLDDYNEYTERLGKIARQRKVRIEQLEKLLDDRCDRCIERERKETAEKFAERLKELADSKLEFYGVRMVDVVDIDEICKELTGDN